MDIFILYQYFELLTSHYLFSIICKIKEVQ